MGGNFDGVSSPNLSLRIGPILSATETMAAKATIAAIVGGMALAIGMQTRKIEPDTVNRNDPR